MKKYIITTLVLILLGGSIIASAQIYEKEGNDLKVTASVSTVYDVAKIKERIVDLNDYITLAQAQIITFQKEIEDLQKLLTEATKVGIEVDAIAEPVEP